jgi:hypothetical protein
MPKYPKKERDQSKDVPDDEATKPQKPKKAFEVLIEIYDDGEMTHRLTEIIKQERGAPRKWLRTPTEFNAGIHKQISERPTVLLEELAKCLNIDLAALLAAGRKDPAAPVKVVDSTATGK